MQPTLQRFLEAQENSYETALAEMRAGLKRSHWMWYVFPQMQGLGYSHMARLYGIVDRQEAVDYLAHPLLGQRLLEITTALLQHHSKTAHAIFGTPDDLKLHSCMTLFAVILVMMHRYFNKHLCSSSMEKRMSTPCNYYKQVHPKSDHFSRYPFSLNCCTSACMAIFFSSAILS